MAQIYKNASYVVAWLGAAEHDSDLAMDWILQQQLKFLKITTVNTDIRSSDFSMKHAWDLCATWKNNSVVADEFELDISDMNTLINAHPPRPMNGQTSPSVPLPPPEPLDMISRIDCALYALFSRPYWRRLWIVQEFKVPNTVVFACGTMRASSMSIYMHLLRHRSRGSFVKTLSELSPEEHNFRPKTVPLLVHTLFSYYDDFLNPLKDVFDTSSILLPAHVSKWGGLSNLVRDVYLHCDFLCQDPRDRVFGLLGLAPEYQDLVEVDYARPTRECFFSFFQLSLESIPRDRMDPSKFPSHTETTRLVKDWFDFTTKLLISMGLMSRPMLETTMDMLASKLESFQAARAGQRCYDCSESRDCQIIRQRENISQILQRHVDLHFEGEENI